MMYLYSQDGVGAGYVGGAVMANPDDSPAEAGQTRMTVVVTSTGNAART
jgi:hypothetical protein